MSAFVSFYLNSSLFMALYYISSSQTLVQIINNVCNSQALTRDLLEFLEWELDFSVFNKHPVNLMQAAHWQSYPIE